MKIHAVQIEILPEKILDYLLVHKEKNDKSAFLFALGYSKDNWENLAEDIKNLALKNDLHLERANKFGNLYSVKGTLKQRKIITIWLQQISNNVYRFITLYPDKDE